MKPASPVPPLSPATIAASPPSGFGKPLHDVGRFVFPQRDESVGKCRRISKAIGDGVAHSSIAMTVGFAMRDGHGSAGPGAGEQAGGAFRLDDHYSSARWPRAAGRHRRRRLRRGPRRPLAGRCASAVRKAHRAPRRSSRYSPASPSAGSFHSLPTRCRRRRSSPPSPRSRRQCARNRHSCRRRGAYRRRTPPWRRHAIARPRHG